VEEGKLVADGTSEMLGSLEKVGVPDGSSEEKVGRKVVVG
jgi:hypothetical protein